MTINDQNQQPKIDLIWTRLEQSNHDKQPLLSREQIVRAAIDLADTQGAQALSMRRLAAKLGAGTMSLYWYISRKEDLLDLLVDAVLGEVELPAYPSGDWRADIHLLAMQTRTVMLRHTWLASLIGSRPGLGPNWLKRLEFSLAAVDGLGLAMTDMAGILSTVDGYVIGFVLRELEEEVTKRRTGMTEAEWQAAIGPYMQQLITSGNYPHLARYIAESEDRDIGESFTFGLDRLLDGIAAYIARQRP
ncbi:MAG TPA: TetR/AcrR family transcriptional regulator C-terminal domain-containing protein [Ktedonobacteraceae bacterium]